MAVFSIRLPDVGEGVAEAELVEWNVKVGDTILEDEMLGSVMTDKAAVEIPSSATGKVLWLGGEIGDVIAVGAELVQLEVESATVAGARTAEIAHGSKADSGSEGTATITPAESASTTGTAEKARAEFVSATPSASAASNAFHSTGAGAKPLAAPSVRKRARDQGIDLRLISGTGPAGRISHEDLAAHAALGVPAATAGRVANTSIEEVKVVGMRRKIAQKMALSKARIPHITIVEEVDVTNLEELRGELNETHDGQRPKLTVLPFMMKAIVESVKDQPELNALYDDEEEIIHVYGGVHIGIATQTPKGLMVPVVKHCETLTLWDSATEVMRLAECSRDGSATREELTGSTITITSLGALGALATTPIINHPEVVIIGINKIATRPFWDGQQFVPRKMMNVSASFDHRVIDGWVAAVMVQKLKTLLEKPAMLFVEN